MRNWNAIIRDWNTTARSWKLLTRNHTFHFTWGRNCFFVRGRTFSFNSGRAGCNASRDHQYEIQSKRRRNFRQHARQGSIGGNTPGNGSGFRDLDSPENELENLRARIKPTIQENVDKSLQQQNVSYRNAGSTLSGILVASPSGAAGPSLPEPDTETNRQLKRVHTFSIAEGHLRTNPETGSTESTQEDQEPLATSTAFVYTRKPASDFVCFLNEGPINMETLSPLTKVLNIACSICTGRTEIQFLGQRTDHWSILFLRYCCGRVSRPYSLKQ